jgi:LPS O-antigen subunit length determinant protein (WzzB/FepE family)
MVLILFGVACFLCALGTLLFFAVREWSAVSLVDRILQLALLVSALAGAFFLQTGMRNLGVRPRLTLRRH